MAETNVPDLIADLKITVVQGHIRQILEHAEVLGELSINFSYLKEKVDEMHKEIVKNPVTEYWEAAGFGGIAAGIEKLYEGEGIGTAINYWLSNGAGALAAIVIGGVALYISGKLTNIQRSIQEFFSRDGLIRGYDANGDVTRQTRRAIEDRERRVANGGTSLADLVSNPANAQQAETLARALEKLNPQVERFDAKAPSFLNSFQRLPNQSKADKAATVLGTVGEAIKKVNTAKLKKIADGLEKLNRELDTFQPTKLPTDTQLGNTAQAMSNLVTQTESLREKFQGLRGSISSLDDVIAGSGAR
ncbi:hypothetical protein AB0E83_12750 [Streptomyces sp. NPDC035033]|uniref:hypothetical protein n=1 Tax=Streptomyces sp. NPDC035033 TaxID=3155368 RepID=UPI0033C2A91D